MLQYIKLKVAASVVRTVVYLRGSMPRKPSPDEKITITTRDGGTIVAHVYRPPGQSSDTKPSKAVINWHGSGFLLPLHGESDRLCRQWANEAGVTVYDCSYRLAPEYPFPTAYNDTEDAVAYVLEHIEPTAGVVLSGSSAGGNLALCISAHSEKVRDRVIGVIGIYPADLATPPESRVPPKQPTGPPVLPVALVKLFNDCYLGLSKEVQRNSDGTFVPDPRFSPMVSPIKNFPDNLAFFTCEFDPLCDEGESMAEKIKAGPTRSGTGQRNVIVKRSDGVDHGWDVNAATSFENMPEDAAQRRTEIYALAVDMLKSIKWTA